MYWRTFWCALLHRQRHVAPGLTLLLISNMIAFAIAFVLAVFGMMNLLPASQWIAAVVFAVRANRDFYRYKVLGENGWL